MPVILENGSDAIRTWLDPNRYDWSKDLQSLLKPFEGELEIYPVTKDVGKVGNNSPSFIIPINSSENKNNIANFFGNQKKAAKVKEEKDAAKSKSNDDQNTRIKTERSEEDELVEAMPEDPESNAPLPTTPSKPKPTGLKREFESAMDNSPTDTSPIANKLPKTTSDSSPSKSGRKFRSATSNGSSQKASPSKAAQGSQKITNFFGKR
jgi:hypothetical protein